MNRFAKYAVVAPLAMTVLYLPGGEGVVLQAEGAAASLHTKYEMPLTLNQRRGRYAHVRIAKREIAFGSTEAADVLTHIMQDR